MIEMMIEQRYRDLAGYGFSTTTSASAIAAMAGAARPVANLPSSEMSATARRG